jgi:hypothetical protein
MLYAVQVNLLHHYTTIHSSKSAWAKKTRNYIKKINYSKGNIKVFETKNTVWYTGFRCQKDAFAIIEEIKKRLGFRIGL